MTSHAENPSPHPDQLALDAQGHLGRDLPCRTCGYNLRGLAADGACPECGTAVTWSLQHDLLRYSDPAWVKGLGSGVGMILTAVLTIIGGYVLLFVVAIVVGAVESATAAPGSTVRSSNLMGAIAAGVMLVAGLAAMALNLLGTWRLTAPDPGRKSEPEGVSVRATARWGVIGGWLLYLGGALLSVVNEFAGLLMLLGAVLLLAGFIAILVHLRRLALRVPDRSLGAQTTIVMWGIITMWVGWLLMFVGMLVWVFAMFAAGGPGGGGGAAGVAGATMVGGFGLATFGCVFAVASVVFGIWLLVLLVMYRATFNRAAEEAAATAPLAVDPMSAPA